MGKSEKIILEFLKFLKKNQELIIDHNIENEDGLDVLLVEDTLIKVSQGLCDNLGSFNPQNGYFSRVPSFSTILVTFKNLISTWEHYTGSKYYPIPGFRSDLNPYSGTWSEIIHEFDHDKGANINVYKFHAFNGINMYRGSYGGRRWQLVDYLIKELENDQAINSE